MAEYLGPATDNEAEVLATGIAGRKVPDTFATGDQDKFSDIHTKRIHNDLSRYEGDTPEGFC
jgi:hypothetical protein